MSYRDQAPVKLGQIKSLISKILNAIKNISLIKQVKLNGVPLVPDAEKAVDVKAYNEDNKPEIGGRNYALDTNSGAAHWRWSTDGDTTNTVESILINGRNGVKLTRSSNEMGGYSYIQYNLPNLKALLPDTVYTVSCMVYSTNGFSPNFIIQEGTAANKLSNQSGGTQIPKGSWGKYISTIRTVSEDNFNLTNQVLYFSMSAEQSAPNAEVIIYDLKLERGEIPTDWTPAPEDLENEPGSISNAFSILESTDLNTLTEVGFYKCGLDATVETLKNMPAEVSHAFSMAVLDINAENHCVAQIISEYGPTENNIYIRDYFTHYEWSQWRKVSKITDIGPDNFNGILPIEKGGTGNATPFANTTPLPSNITGSTGVKTEFARGDHVHPFSDLEVISKSSISAYADLNDFYKNGFYMLHDLSTFKNAPQDVPYDFGMLMVFNTDADYGEKYVQQIIALNAGYSKFIWTRTANGPSYEANYVWSPWVRIATTGDITASNFSGILPIEKGGTGSTTGIPIATTTTAGLIKPGKGLQISDDGALDVADALECHTLAVEDTIIASYATIDNLTVYNINIQEPLTVDVLYASAIYSDYIPSKTSQLENDSEFIAKPDIPTASFDTLGMVKVGEGLGILEDGTLNVTGIPSTGLDLFIAFDVRYDPQSLNPNYLFLRGINPLTQEEMEFPITQLFYKDNTGVKTHYTSERIEDMTGIYSGILSVALEQLLGDDIYSRVNFQIPFHKAPSITEPTTISDLLSIVKAEYPGGSIAFPATGYFKIAKNKIAK